MNERADLWPILLRCLPARSTMTHWATEVDLYLKAKAELDRRRQQTNQTTGGQE